MNLYRPTLDTQSLPRPSCLKDHTGDKCLCRVQSSRVWTLLVRTHGGPPRARTTRLRSSFPLPVCWAAWSAALSPRSEIHFHSKLLLSHHTVSSATKKGCTELWDLNLHFIQRWQTSPGDPWQVTDSSMHHTAHNDYSGSADNANTATKLICMPNLYVVIATIHIIISMTPVTTVNDVLINTFTFISMSIRSDFTNTCRYNTHFHVIHTTTYTRRHRTCYTCYHMLHAISCRYYPMPIKVGRARACDRWARWITGTKLGGTSRLFPSLPPSLPLSHPFLSYVTGTQLQEDRLESQCLLPTSHTHKHTHTHMCACVCHINYTMTS